ncbi:MAG: hypothetical protein Q9M45_01460 [Robiginitomaculum sp.]|nr:hypothetical protein [Robiginitomaculum sp.]
MPSLERLMLHRLYVMDAEVRTAYEELDYKARLLIALYLLQ